MPEPLLRHVFVYGTLRRGGRDDINRLLPAPQCVGLGETQGVLYHFDLHPWAPADQPWRLDPVS